MAETALRDIIPGALNVFFASLRERGRGVLILDYDGTLAPFHVDRYRALPSPGVAELLDAIHAQGRTRIVFNTGRPAREILRMVTFDPHVEIWGCHGREHRLPNDTSVSHGVAEDDLVLLREAERLAHSVAHGGIVETKTGCVAIHWRPLDESTRTLIRTSARWAWEPLLKSHRLEIEVFNGGIELSVVGRSKGDAVAAILSSNIDRYPVAFLGDDLSDENGFRVLKGRGLSVLVEAERATEADAWSSLGPGVVAFLSRWREALDVGRSGNQQAPPPSA